VSLEQRYIALQKEMSAYPQASMVAVSKYTNHANIRLLAKLGQVAFGESRPQQLRDRARLFPELDFHMIGPLQKNKAKYIGRYASMWHSLIDMETAQLVNKYVTSSPLPTLLQVKLGQDSGQHGIPLDRVKNTYEEACHLHNLDIKGLMCMAPKDQNAREVFQSLKTLLFDIGHGKLSVLSMGMSGDFNIALSEGSTMVRLGRVLFNHEGKVQ